MSVFAREDAPPTREDVPRRTPFDRGRAIEISLSALASIVLVWIPFHLGGWNAPFGFFVCSFGSFVAIFGIVVRQRHGAVEMKDQLATVAVWTSVMIALLALVLILYYVLQRGGKVLFTKFPSFSFLRQDMRNFGPNDPFKDAGMKAAIVGSLEQVLTATAITLPIGVLAATYLNEIGGRFASAVRTVTDAMTGLPTIIAGLFVYAAWVAPRHHNGYSGFAAALALAVVMLPTIVRTAEEVLRIVSDNLREAALALGAPEWRMVLQVVIPTARSGLVTAAILGVARAIGETAPVVLTASGSTRTNWNLFHGPQSDLPLQIYQLARSPSNNNNAVAWGGALVLALIILTLFSLARIVGTGGAGKRFRLPTGKRRS
jgi:phosphate transport system permease protein